jgi:peroxiredoxin
MIMDPRASLLVATLALAVTAHANPTKAPSPKDTSARASAPVAATPAPASAKAAGLKTLPDFTLPDLDGKTHASKDWKGQVVLVDFWATWCAACRETIPALARLQDKYKSQGLHVVGVSLDKGPKAKVSKFAKKLKVNYQILLDADDTLSKVFGFEGLPSIYVFDRQGNLLKGMAGYTAVQDKELEELVAAQFKAAP